MISKAQAIRNVAKQDCSITNGHVKQLVKERYGLEVQTNQINNTLSELNKWVELTGSIEEVIRKALSKMI